MSENNHYQRIGGETGVRNLVDRFYDLMDTLPEAYEIRKLHAPDPPLYEQAYGHPRLRMRHLPFAIGERERDEWMLCMEQAMQDTGVEAELAQELKSAFYRVADFMRNREG